MTEPDRQPPGRHGTPRSCRAVVSSRAARAGIRPASGTRCLLAAIALLAWPLAQAVDRQSMHAPASAQAEAIASLGGLMTGLFAAVLAIVLALLAYALWRGWRGAPRELGEEASRRLVILGGVAIPAMVLFALVIVSVRVGERVMSQAPPGALTIEVTGWQWWWQVRYLDRDGAPVAVTANEIHVPVGRPVRFLLRSADVIHSFWVPNLQGKIDMIPGRVNSSWFEAAVAGVYRGQCAEFCGVQHALMAFEVVAEPPAEFEDWLARQRQPAAPPATPLLRLGRDVFLGAGCAACHAVRGTPAEGQLGPDLTHVGSRRTLAAATLPNTPGHLGGWISDPQGNKPGNHMPATRLAPDHHGALLAWLESLE